MLTQTLQKLLYLSRSLPTFVRYCLTSVVIMLTALLAIALFNGTVGYVFLLLYPCIIVLGGLLDRGNGIYATLLSGALVALYLHPLRSAAPDAARYYTIALFLYLITGIVAAFVVEAFHAALEKLQQAHAKMSEYAQIQKVLLSEISHRIRNDLAVLTSVVSLQSITLEGDAARKALADIADRLKVLTRVQGHLALESQSVVVDSREYLIDLCNDLKTTLLATLPVSLSVEAENHPIEHQRLVALGLIVNELVTNAVKYAFPSGKTGRIVVRFDRIADSYRLRVEDNGVGLPREIKAGGMGLSLVRSLATQVNGELQAKPSNGGAVWDVTFPVKWSAEGQAI